MNVSVVEEEVVMETGGVVAVMVLLEDSVEDDKSEVG